MNLILNNIMRICTAIVASYVCLMMILAFSDSFVIDLLALFGMAAVVTWAGFNLVGDIYSAIKKACTPKNAD